MKLLCINTGIIYLPGFRCTAGGLKEGEVYETKGKIFKSPITSMPSYYIEGVGVRNAERFTELLEEKSKEVIAIEKLKEEFQLN